MISFLIPALRASVFDTIDHINELDHEDDYEIVVCSKFKVDGRNVVWVQEPEDHLGSIWPINECYRRSRGDHFIVTCDDLFVHPNVLNLPDFLESDVFADRKMKICSVGYEEYHIHETPNYPARIMSFPAGTRETVDTYLGGTIFNESFLHLFADNWLAYYVAHQGEDPVFMPDTLNIQECDNRSASHVTYGYDHNVYMWLCNNYDGSYNTHIKFQ